MITVFIRSLEFYGYHGVPAEERAVGHRYTADVELKVDSKAEFSDDVSDTVDYAGVANLILSTSENFPCKTLERFANLVGTALLSEFPAVLELTLRIAKRLPPAPVIAEQMGIEIKMVRS